MKLTKPASFRFFLANRRHISLKLTRLPQRFFSTPESPAPASSVNLSFDPSELQLLESGSVNKQWFLSAISQLERQVPDAFEKLVVHFDHLFENREELPLLRKELESVRQINTINHEKVNVVRHKIEDLDKEMTSMQTRLSKEIQKEKETALRTFATEAVQMLSELRAADTELSRLVSKATGEEAEGLQTFLTGFRMIESSGSTIFKRYDLHVMEVAEGAVFNKALHDAENDIDGQRNLKATIKEIKAPGYLMGKEVLRKAKVVLNNN